MNKIILGETCLCEYQLYRTGVIDGPHGCFDSIKINLDGILGIINDDFKYMLSDGHLQFEDFEYYPGISYPKWINTKYSSDVDIMFSWPVYSLFHLDGMMGGRESYQRKIDRTKSMFEDAEPTVLFYYYRFNSDYNVELLLSKLNSFVELLTTKYDKRFLISAMTYNPSEESSISISSNTTIHHTTFNTSNSWIETDDNWSGACDNALFDEYAIAIKNWIV